MGSRIPIEDEEGARSYLKHDGEFVYDAPARGGAAGARGRACRGRFTWPRDRRHSTSGASMRDYAMEKPVAGAVGDGDLRGVSRGGVFPDGGGAGAVGGGGALAGRAGPAAVAGAGGAARCR